MNKHTVLTKNGYISTWKTDKGIHVLEVSIGKYMRRKLNGQLHCDNGPAAVYANGDKFWYINGKRHREDGPAAVYYGSSEYWYLNGMYYGNKCKYALALKELRQDCIGRGKDD